MMDAGAMMEWLPTVVAETQFAARPACFSGPLVRPSMPRPVAGGNSFPISAREPF